MIPYARSMWPYTLASSRVTSSPGDLPGMRSTRTFTNSGLSTRDITNSL